MSKLTDIMEAIPICEDYMVGVDDGCCTCPYIGRCKDLVPDTLKMLEELGKRVQQLEREKEALLEELRGRCTSCKNLDESHYPCKQHTGCVLARGVLWEWRGVEEDDE